MFRQYLFHSSCYPQLRRVLLSVEPTFSLSCPELALSGWSLALFIPGYGDCDNHSSWDETSRGFPGWSMNESWTVRLLGFSWPGSLSVIRFAFSSWEGSMPIPFIQMLQESHPIIPNLIQCHLISSHLISFIVPIYIIFSYCIVSCLILSCLIIVLLFRSADLSYLYLLSSDYILSYSIWSYPIKFYPVLSIHLCFN